MGLQDERGPECSERELLLGLAERVRACPASFAGVPDMARALGVDATRLDTLFHQYFHRCAIRFLTEARVGRACRMLAETRDGIVEIGQAVGYGNRLDYTRDFRRLTGLCPEEYRSMPIDKAFTLSPPAGLEPAEAFRFQGRDRDSLCERSTPSSLVKALVIDGRPTVLEMTASGETIRCELHPRGSLSPAAVFTAHHVSVRLLGLTMDPGPFEKWARRDPLLRPMIERHPGLRVFQTANVFEGLTWAIIGQQINLPFAFQLRRDLVRLAGYPVEPGLFAHPTPEQVASLDYADLQRLKFSRRKAEYLIDTARLVAGGDLRAESLPRATAEEAQERLLGVRGIGPWSSNYLAMRACGFGDCVPIGDTGLTAGLQRLFGLGTRPDAKETARLMARFTPYRSFVTFHLWRMMGGGA